MTPTPSALTPEASAVDTSFLPPAPAVDLPASLRAAVTAAAVALHTEAVTHVDLDAFVLVDADHGPHFAAAVSVARKALAALFNRRFDRHPTRAVGSVAAAGFAFFMIFGSPAERPRTQLAGAPHHLAPDVVLGETPPAELATELRNEARGVCRRGEWRRCLDLLDDAADLDPAGDQAPEIQAARDAATQGFDDALRQERAKP